MAIQAQTKPRRTQQERSTATRERLMEATIECLVELGYAGTTTTEIASRAGVSRGAQLHHYPTKADLVLSAVEHMAYKWGMQVQRKADALPRTRDRIGATIDLLWGDFSGPLFYAALELWVAARTDPELHASLHPVERRVGRAMKASWTEVLEGAGIPRRRARDLTELTLHLVRGMALERILRPDDSHRVQLLDTWKRMILDQARASR